jgi:hypothetical protein
LVVVFFIIVVPEINLHPLQNKGDTVF